MNYWFKDLRVGIRAKSPAKAKLILLRWILTLEPVGTDLGISCDIALSESDQGGLIVSSSAQVVDIDKVSEADVLDKLREKKSIIDLEDR